MASQPRFTVLQVVPALDAGGVEQTALDVAGAIVAAGGRTLVASSGGRLEPRLVERGGELVRLPVQSKSPLTVAANALALKALIRREGVDIVHARSRAPAFAAGWAARATRTPFVTTYAGVYNARSPLKRWYNGVMARADRVIANSEFTRAHLIAAHGTDPAKVVTIPRGIDLSAFDASAVAPERVAALRQAWRLDQRPAVLLAGRLTRWKGQGLALEALARLKARGAPEMVLVLAGDAQGRDTYVDELEATIAREGLQDRVRRVGHVADMPAAYLACDLALAPSMEPEAFGRTAVEPQAMGRPVIAADHGAARETVLDGETGWLFPPGDAAALADALEQALDAGSPAWARMGQEGRARVRDRYSLEAMTRATLAVYAELIGR